MLNHLCRCWPVCLSMVFTKPKKITWPHKKTALKPAAVFHFGPTSGRKAPSVTLRSLYQQNECTRVQKRVFGRGHGGNSLFSTLLGVCFFWLWGVFKSLQSPEVTSLTGQHRPIKPTSAKTTASLWSRRSLQRIKGLFTVSAERGSARRRKHQTSRADKGLLPASSIARWSSLCSVCQMWKSGHKGFVLCWFAHKKKRDLQPCTLHF